MNPAPLAAVIVPFSLVLSSLAIYRSIYPYERVKKAMEVMAEYRVLKSQARGKRGLKKVKAMEPQYKQARGAVMRALFVKMLLLLTSYMIGSLLVFLLVPAVPAPFHLPPFTIAGEGGYYSFSITIYFLVYVVTFIVFRDSFL